VVHGSDNGGLGVTLGMTKILVLVDIYGKKDLIMFWVPHKFGNFQLYP